MNPVESIIEELKILDGEYFKKFMEFYPLFLAEEKERIFGPSELYEMAIKAQALLSMLGGTALKRMKYIGFDLMYPFDNPVDWFNWKEEIRNRNIPESIYFSISVRMASEFNRMSHFASRGTWPDYCNLAPGEFLVPKKRYLEHFNKTIDGDKTPTNLAGDKQALPVTQVNIGNLHYNQKTEQKAIDTLDRLQKHSNIWSNIIDVASKIFGIKI